MSDVRVKCCHCGKKVTKRSIDVARARKAGHSLYCNRICSGLGRRLGKTKAEKVAAKRLYDMEYRAKNRAMLKAKKAEYFQRTYDPAKAAVERKKRMPQHVEYCRRPEYRAWKAKYDAKYRAQKDFGPFAEAAMLTNDLKREIKERITDYEIRQANEKGNTQIRRREGRKGPERSRTARKRGDDHTGLYG